MMKPETEASLARARGDDPKTRRRVAYAQVASVAFLVCVVLFLASAGKLGGMTYRADALHGRFELMDKGRVAVVTGGEYRYMQVLQYVTLIAAMLGVPSLFYLGMTRRESDTNADAQGPR